MNVRHFGVQMSHDQLFYTFCSEVLYFLTPPVYSGELNYFTASWAMPCHTFSALQRDTGYSKRSNR